MYSFFKSGEFLIGVSSISYISQNPLFEEHTSVWKTKDPPLIEWEWKYPSSMTETYNSFTDAFDRGEKWVKWTDYVKYHNYHTYTETTIPQAFKYIVEEYKNNKNYAKSKFIAKDKEAPDTPDYDKDTALEAAFDTYCNTLNIMYYHCILHPKLVLKLEETYAGNIKYNLDAFMENGKKFLELARELHRQFENHETVESYSFDGNVNVDFAILRKLVPKINFTILNVFDRQLKPNDINTTVTAAYNHILELTDPNAKNFNGINRKALLVLDSIAELVPRIRSKLISSYNAFYRKLEITNQFNARLAAARANETNDTWVYNNASKTPLYLKQRPDVIALVRNQMTRNLINKFVQPYETLIAAEQKKKADALAAKQTKGGAVSGFEGGSENINVLVNLIICVLIVVATLLLVYLIFTEISPLFTHNKNQVNKYKHHCCY